MSGTNPGTTAPAKAQKAAKFTEKTIKPERSHETSRPQMPSKQRISLSYDGEYLTFGFVVPEGQCEVAIAEWYSGAVLTYTIDSTGLSDEIYVGELYESTVTITTEKGHTYTAELSAEEED